eukprot:8937747-Pyramimonas_sp.AAC.1
MRLQGILGVSLGSPPQRAQQKFPTASPPHHGSGNRLNLLFLGGGGASRVRPRRGAGPGREKAEER